MRLRPRIPGWLLASIGLWLPLTAPASDSATNPYQEIVLRNVFGLKPPPPPPSPDAAKPPPSKITLTGITTILGNKRALMKSPAPAKSGQPISDRYYLLAEGQRDGDLEVLEIDEIAGTVKVANAGTVTTLHFSDTGSRPSPPPSLLTSDPSLPSPGALPLADSNPNLSTAPATLSLASAPTALRGQPAPSAANQLSATTPASNPAWTVATTNAMGNRIPGTWRRSMRLPLSQ